MSAEEASKWLILSKETKLTDNLTVRFYRLPHIDNAVDEAGFINYVLKSIQGYVFDVDEIKELINDGEDPFESAIKFFGDVDPLRDGRYGELILYILTEGLLGVPLVVHKIAQSYSPNKQVEGSDGLFIGNFGGELSLMIGEAKMRTRFSVCLPDAVGSIERFKAGNDALSHEIKVARKHLSKDINNLDQDALTHLYNSMKFAKPEFDQFKISHPILLVYKEKDIGKIEAEVEKAVTEIIQSNSEKIEKSITSTVSELKDNTLHFFLVPVADVNQLRKNLYKAFHDGQEYIKKDGEKAEEAE